MYICEYCGRYLKKKYEKCPACGSKTFKKVQNIGEVVIKTPPKDGYKVNLTNLKHERKGHRPGTIIGLWVILFGIVFCTGFVLTGISIVKDGLVTGYIFIGFAIFAFIAILKVALEFFGVAGKIIKGSNKNINKVKQLAKNGILIKNLKYKVVPVKGAIQGDKTTYKVQVIYEIEKGKTKCFESEPKYLTALGRDDGTVDLLVDPNDYSNYFVDFEIY